MPTVLQWLPEWAMPVQPRLSRHVIWTNLPDGNTETHLCASSHHEFMMECAAFEHTYQHLPSSFASQITWTACSTHLSLCAAPTWHPSDRQPQAGKSWGQAGGCISRVLSQGTSASEKAA